MLKVTSLGIVIPTLDRPESLRRVLARLESQRRAAGRFEVVVVHGPGAAAQIRAAVDARPYTIHALTSPRPDASTQRNVGWRALSTPLVLFLGDDILATPDLVHAHLEAHARAPQRDVGVLGRVRWPKWPPPSAFMRWLDQGIQFDFRGLAPNGEVGWWHFYTANASVKREALECVDGFDEARFPFLYEDLDLAARMAQHGFTLTYEPAAVGVHVHPQTLERWRSRIALIAAAERTFCERHPQAAAYFYDLFTTAASEPAEPAWPAKLAGLIPRRTPWLGPRVWARFDRFSRQQLAPDFLAAWKAEGRAGEPVGS